MGILSEDQVKRIRAIRSKRMTRQERQQIVARSAERLAAAAGVDWHESLRQRAAEFYRGSQDRGIEWTLEFAHAMILMAAPCKYCGVLENNRFNGLDRVDNSKGYTLENVVSCCRWCNRAKGRNDAEEFTVWIEWVKGSRVREFLGSAFQWSD